MMNGPRTPLIAVLLVTRSRPGPKLVFHYPPVPTSRAAKVDQARSFESDDDSENDAGNTDLPALLRAIGPKRGGLKSSHALGEAETGREHSRVGGDLLGFPQDSLEKLLSPGCWCDRKKFEVCVDGLTFVSYPMYADNDDSWARKHTHTPTNRKSEDWNTAPSKIPPAVTEDSNDNVSMQVGITITEPKTPSRSAVQDFTHVPESLDSYGGQSLATSANSGSTASAIAPERLTSFHAVFVLSSSSADSKQQVLPDIYQHVAKKLSKALHYCQKETSYVGIESRKLLALKAKAAIEKWSAAMLSNRMVQASELAWALREIYEKISIGSTAGFRLNGQEMSLQIPSVSNISDAGNQLDRHSSLLLLEDKDSLLRELAHTDASPLVYFIREFMPTKSLQKQATKLCIPINDVLYLAAHLIKWQKARAISPLHPRNMYIVGRNAPLNRLEHYVAEYARTFSALPSLPQVLKVLSGRPTRYGMLIPSRDHRAPYMEILAYLVRHQFVEQLKTSGWLQVPAGGRKATMETKVNKNRRPISVASLLSPQLRPVDDDTVSVSSERTAIPVSIADTLRKDSEAARSVGVAANGRSTESKAPRIIADPLDPSIEDAGSLEYIKESIADEEFSNRLPSLYPYFDGEAVLEDLAAREGLKRSKVESWFERLQEDGLTMTFRRL